MAGTMKALVKSRREPGLWMEDRPIPAIGPNDLLIRIRKTAICGTDMHIFTWDDWAKATIPVPMAIGHEFAGVVAEVGSAVAGFSEGDRVSGEGHITCGYCRNCRAGRRHLCRNTKGVGVNRDGCFGEYLSLPAGNAFKIPDDISDELASVFDPFGNATHTALSFDLVGEDVLITGAGPIGCMAAAICRHVGARHVVVTDVNDYRLGLAKELGATRTVNAQGSSLSEVMKELGMSEGFDVGLEMSGSGQAFQSMLEVMNHGGRVAILGIFPQPVPIDWSKVVFKGLHLKGIYGREMFETWYKMTSMLQSGLDIGRIVTHRLGVERFLDGFAAMKAGQAGKVVLDW
jgi:threonine 3-dehydrogenase